MTLDRLSENVHLPYDRKRIERGGGALADYLNDLIKDIEQKQLLQTNYFVNRMRQTWSENAGDSCAPFYPMTLDFKIPTETWEIVSVLLSFKIRKYRADSTGAASGGGATSSAGGAVEVTSAAGGGQTSSSGGGGTTSAGGGQTSSSGGGGTSGSGGGQTSSSGGGQTTSAYNASASSTQQEDAHGETGYADGSVGSHKHTFTEQYPGHSHGISSWSHDHTVSDHTHTVSDHTHTVSNHTHTVSDHTHTVPNHTHTVSDHTHLVAVPNHTHTMPNHTHDLIYGIYEYEPEDPPVVYFQIDNGSGWGPASENYTTAQVDLDITDQITSTGWKSIAFHVSDLCYIKAIVEIKVNIKPS
jgi:hypothetical protein